MASIATSDDENSEENYSTSSHSANYSSAIYVPPSDESSVDYPVQFSSHNIVTNLINREIYGRIAKSPRAKTEPILKDIHPSCRFPLGMLLSDTNALYHVFMGFTLCGQYILSYTEKEQSPSNPTLSSIFLETSYEYVVYIWKFAPGEKLQHVSHHKIFNHIKAPSRLERIMFMQFPNDMHKLVCYGCDEARTPDLFHISILTLPSPTTCIHCFSSRTTEEVAHRGWCAKHGFIVHYMFATSQPAPVFDPKISLSFPNHLVINTGYHIHILNISTTDPTHTDLLDAHFESGSLQTTPNPISNDTLSDVSETASDNFGTNSVVDAIIEDFSEYDLESSEGSKPFHELNISCEPLNVTGKSYHNTLVQNIFDPRIKRLQHGIRDYVFSVPHASNQKPPENNKVVDKNVAEKAYEFTEENENYEKISLFRKKRLADKKYEFSEDNTENIVPLHILRRERRYISRSQSRSIRSPEFNSLFLSPRSPGWRSPMQSPSSRNGQFSPSGVRHIYCTSVRSSPYHSKSPISPRDLTRKVNMYTPSLDGDCSDSESRLVLRTSAHFPTAYCHFSNDSRFNHHGLLIVDPKRESAKWIKKVVRRYSSGDFETSSLLSGQSRDDYSNPIEVPSLVQSLTDQHLDVVPDYRADHETERQILVSQRSMDCEQFVQRRAQALCSDANLQFMHCEDYDIRVLCVCPLNGEILCQAVIKIGALKTEANTTIHNYWSYFLFTWNIATDAFDVIDSNNRKLFTGEFPLKLFTGDHTNSLGITEMDPPNNPRVEVPKFHCNEVWVLTYDITKQSKKSLRDSKNLFEIYLAGNVDGFDISSSWSDLTDFSFVESEAY